MIEEILPPWVASAEAFDDPPGVALFPEEEARRRPGGGQAAARVHHRPRLRPPGPGPPRAAAGADPARRARRPGWPAAWSAASPTAPATGPPRSPGPTRWPIGIDAEPHEPLPDGVLDAVSLPEERAALRGAADGDVHWDRLLFSAKESVYKAWFPLTRRWLGFEEADLVLDPDAARSPPACSSPARSWTAGELTGFTGRWLVADGLVVTAIAVPGKSVPGESVSGESVGSAPGESAPSLARGRDSR